MSHFTVMVIGPENEEELAKAMEPYWELNLGDDEAKDDPRASFKIEIAAVDLDGKIKELREKYKNFEDDDETVIKNHYGHILRDENGNYGWFVNVNAKWDWYCVGGRWDGEITLKNGEKVNTATIGEIDFEYIDHDKKLGLEEEWDIDMGIRTGRRVYKSEFLLGRYGTKEEYVRRNLTFETFAVITQDGKWHEKGQMGWFAISTETDDEDKEWFDNYYDRFIKPLSPDTRIWIVDAHI